jgi:ribosomal protein S27E
MDKPINGIFKCSGCGSSDIQFNIASGLLHCNYCHSEFSELADAIDGDISMLYGKHWGDGASPIAFDSDSVVTLKCTACGAEVIIDTDEALQARCHWCRNFLSLNSQVPNGAVPDAILPFKIPKEQAHARIKKFIKRTRFFAPRQFRKEFTLNNIMGVYLPYLVIDVNAHASFFGSAQRTTKRYEDERESLTLALIRGLRGQSPYLYDADDYKIKRSFDFYVDDLTIEASNEKLYQATNLNSNNVINTILPFPMNETLRFNANYLHGFTAEKRDVNPEQLRVLAGAQAKDIARYQAWKLSKVYDRGINWETEEVIFKGSLWKTAYLPIWLYSFMETKKMGKKFMHYAAVNACTGETMGSVPFSKLRLLMSSLSIVLLTVLLTALAACGFSAFILRIDSAEGFSNLVDSAFARALSGFANHPEALIIAVSVFLFALLLFYIFFYAGYRRTYRNDDERHHHEKETSVMVANVEREDQLYDHHYALMDEQVYGANHFHVEGVRNVKKRKQRF